MVEFDINKCFAYYWNGFITIIPYCSVCFHNVQMFQLICYMFRNYGYVSTSIQLHANRYTIDLYLKDVQSKPIVSITLRRIGGERHMPLWFGADSQFHPTPPPLHPTQTVERGI